MIHGDETLICDNFSHCFRVRHSQRRWTRHGEDQMTRTYFFPDNKKQARVAAKPTRSKKPSRSVWPIVGDPVRPLVERGPFREQPCGFNGRTGKRRQETSANPTDSRFLENTRSCPPENGLRGREPSPSNLFWVHATPSGLMKNLNHGRLRRYSRLG